MNDVRWHYRKNPQQVAHSAVHWILLKAQEAISHKGVFNLVLAGGTTPRRIYELLSEQHQQWSKWHLFLGDERCLDVEDNERNSVMIKQSWLNPVDFPMDNFHPIHAEQGPEQAAEDYAQLIKTVIPFDLTLSGIGEDGHTASLFPGQQYDENKLVHAVYNAPKPPSERVSLSKKAFFQSRKLIILVTGAGKKTAVSQWQQGEDLPVAQLNAINGVDVLIDNDAQPQ